MARVKIIVCSSLLFGLFSCKQGRPQDIVKENFYFASGQLSFAMTEVDKAIAEEPETERIKREGKNQGPLINPRTINPDGTLRLVSSQDWTSGFFPGELWYMYEYTKDSKWEQVARKYTDPLEREKSNGMTHDMGFKMYCSFGNGYRLTRDENYKQILLESAYTLITRYKPNAKIIRSWDHNKDKWQSPVIIDNMMNLELLFWAFNESKDSVFYNVAVNHAFTTMKNHFRQDYSTYHVVDYDTITGKVLKKNTHQGYADESAWSRGQSWAIYGYTLCYRETKIPEFLEQAKSVVQYNFTNPNLPEDLIPYWDFDAPGIPDEPRDASAASCMASALYELSLYDAVNSVRYKKWADTILDNLTMSYRAEPNVGRGFLLLHSTGSKPSDSEVDVPLCYADYYFLEALLRKQKLETTGAVF
jgi:hypothetical protein